MKGRVDERDNRAQLWLHKVVDEASSHFCQHFCETSGMVLLKSEQLDSFRSVELNTSRAPAKINQIRISQITVGGGHYFIFPVLLRFPFYSVSFFFVLPFP